MSHKHTLNPSQQDTGAQGISGAFRIVGRQISFQAGMLEDPGGKLKRETHLWEGADDVPRPTWLPGLGVMHRQMPQPLVWFSVFCFVFHLQQCWLRKADIKKKLMGCDIDMNSSL